MPVTGDVLSLKDALAFSFQQADVVRWYWSFYFTVAVGLLGFLAGLKLGQVAYDMRWLLVVGFLLFAGANLMAIDGVQQERQALRTMAESQAQSSDEKNVVARLGVLDRSVYVSFHVVLDVVVAVSLCFLVDAKTKGLRGQARSAAKLE